ncbi:hypothetical protein J8I26_09810 [Herbaspirillum sp. LeCh32-8]|uniref:hypothetical protein n=1 Tax=Herbaspirillum sp. LeCh32-8 TaxID=2821356 RepID=UPI001AE42D1D|nr:hypothetical protein [Herbaspirillum sp. LeCh32-8]MBP0598399.1 hypothetical protein [Herbaspirillum sp. LeCh32-8]
MSIGQRRPAQAKATQSHQSQEPAGKARRRLLEQTGINNKKISKSAVATAQ